MLIAFVTYSRLPDLTADDRLAAEELRRRGAEVEAVIWNDPGVLWSRYDRVVIRSCWDYFERTDEFLAWLDRMEKEKIPLWNPIPLVRGNLDKAYLGELAAAGLPVIPTAGLEHGAAVDLAGLLDERGWNDVVIKPSISGGAFRTWRISRDEAAAAQGELDELLASSGVLIQPFLSEIQTAGEWSLIFLGGEYSHAALKRPRAGDFRVQEQLGGSTEAARATPALIEQARAVVVSISGPWIYARVDGVEIDGLFTLMELELIEPSLFLATDPRAPARFAEAILC
jgi:glutathione synthase/RimK-type ligase-like ATP-grasp enzyme